MNDDSIDVDGVRLHYVEDGTGPTLVFVHGWGLDLHSWDAQIRFFRDRFRVVAYDWRGHGLSDSTPPYAFSALAQELDGLLTRLGVTTPILCGHSMGGTIVMELVATHARPVSGLLLIDTTLPGTRRDRFEYWARCEGASLTTEALAWAVGKRRALEMVSSVYGRLFWSDAWRRDHPREYAAWRRRFADGNFTGMINAYRASIHRPDPEPALRRLALPALVVNGTADRVFSVRMAKRIASALRGAELALVDGAGHMSMCERPELVNGRLDDFLRQIETAT